MNSTPTTVSTPVIQITIPTQHEWLSLVRLLISGLGNQLDFLVEEIEDLKIAVEELIMYAASEEHVHVSFSLAESSIRARLYPLNPEVLVGTMKDIFHSQPGDNEQDDPLRRVLNVLVDSFGVESVDEQGFFTVRLEKMRH